MAARTPRSAEQAHIANNPPLSMDVSTLSSSALTQLKKIFRADGAMVDVADDYVLREGERWVEEPSSPELTRAQSAMRAALDPSGVDNTGKGKLPFNFGFFSEAFPIEDKNENITMKGKEPQNVPLRRRSKKAPVGKLLSMLPHSLAGDGHLARVFQPDTANQQGGSNPSPPSLRSSDPSRDADQLRQGLTLMRQGRTSEMPDPVRQHLSQTVNEQQFREKMSGYEHARRNNLNLSSLRQPDTDIDFAAEHNETGETHYFDPFTSPQPVPITDRTIARKILEKPGTSAQDHEESSPPDARAIKGWVDKTFKRHTDNSKQLSKPTSGKPPPTVKVLGIWDQTSDSQGEIDKLKTSISGKQVQGQEPPNVSEMDLHLDREYAREDRMAHQQLTHTQNEEFIRTGDSQLLKRYPSSRVDMKRWRHLMGERLDRMGKAKKRKYTVQVPRKQEHSSDSGAWGGPKPGDPGGQQHGPNHPLYWRHTWREDHEEPGGSGIA